MQIVFDNLDIVGWAFAHTVALFLISGVLSMLLGTALAGLRVGPIAVLRRAVSLYITLVRNTPLLIMFIFFRAAAPKIGINFNFVDIVIGDLRMNNFFAAAVAALTLYTSAFVCEAIRSGVNAVPLGQAEAARAIGLPFGGVMQQVGAAPGHPRRRAPAGQRADRPAQEHHRRGRLRRRRGTVPRARLHQQLPRRPDRHLHRLLPHLRGAGRGGVVRRQPARAAMGGGQMSDSTVLFDAPGPRTVARHRLYTVAAIVVLAVVVAFAVYRLYERGQFEYAKWEPLVTPRYIEALLVDGLLVTLQMAVTSVLFAVVFGLVFGVGKLSDHAWVRWPSWLVVEFFRAVPVLFLMILVFFSYGIDRGSSGAYWSVVIALTVYNGAVLAEVFRAGINAVPRGQSEAAYALGMRKTQVMMQILLPQAVKIMLPAIISQMVVALKDTSLGYAVAAPGLTAVGQLIYKGFNNQIPTVMVIAALYIGANLVLTWIATLVQKRFVGRRTPSRPARSATSTAAAACDLRRQRTGRGVTHSRISPSMTTSPSSRVPRTCTCTSPPSAAAPGRSTARGRSRRRT